MAFPLLQQAALMLVARAARPSCTVHDKSRGAQTDLQAVPDHPLAIP